MTDKYDVGYRKPPKHSRFKPGQSGNSAGRPKKYKSLISVLEEPVTMNVKGKKREVTAIEASLRKTAQSALEGQLSAIKRFIRYCDEANLLVDRNRPATHGVFRVPIDPDNYMGRKFTEAERKEIDWINSTLNKPPPEEPPTEKQALIRRVASEKHFIESVGRKMTIFELIQQKLRHRALVERHEPSHAYFEKLLTRTTIDLDPPNVGFLVVPAQIPIWLSPIRIENAETGEEVHVPGPDDPRFDRKTQFRLNS